MDDINKYFITEPNRKMRVASDKRKLDRYEAQIEHKLYVERCAEREFAHEPLTDVPDELTMPTAYFEDVSHKVEYNNFYADYYMQRYSNTNIQKYADISQRIRDCHKAWFGDRYKQSGYFNVKNVFHCHNRWCWLCNHLKQAKRLFEYHLRFESLLKDYDLYHIVFTVSNVTGTELKTALERMHSSLRKIIRYFQGFAKIGGMDFLQYGFVGAIRCFEIVINPTEYHPHLHCLFLLKKGLEQEKTEVCKYSFSNGSKIPLRLFTPLEISLQKIFYLLYNGQKVNEKNISAVKTGYSCIMDLVEGDKWHEVFKYATKMSKDGAAVCSYEQFVQLDDILHKLKMIQGYGLFYNDESKLEEEYDPTTEILFEKVLILLDRNETPERDVSVALDKLVAEVQRKQVTVISKRLAYKYLKSIYDEFRNDLTPDDDYELPF